MINILLFMLANKLASMYIKEVEVNGATPKAYRLNEWRSKVYTYALSRQMGVKHNV